MFLFDPLMECYLGYFLAGYLLANIRITRLVRVLYPLCGIGGFLLGFVGNLRASSAEALSYPFNGGYTLNHYLLAGALFLLARDLTEGHTPPAWLTRPAAYLSDIAFGVYWIHVLALEYAQRLIVPDTAPILLCLLQFLAVIAASLLLMAVLARIPAVRKLLM